MGVAADEGAQVARPDVMAGQLAGQVNAEVGLQPGLVVDGFVVRAHGFSLTIGVVCLKGGACRAWT